MVSKQQRAPLCAVGWCKLTSLAGSGPEAGPCAVTDEAVPSLPTQAVILAGVTLALLPRHLAAGRLDAGAVLSLGYLPDVLAAPVDEQVPDAAHVAVVEHGRPELGGQDEARPVLREPAQIHFPLQVQDLALPAGGERRAAAVHRDGACGEEK